MKFSMALVALVAGVATALPATDSSSWSNSGSNDKQPSEVGKKQPAASSTWSNTGSNNKQPEDSGNKQPNNEDSKRPDNGDSSKWSDTGSGKKQPNEEDNKRPKKVTTTTWAQWTPKATPAGKGHEQPQKDSSKQEWSSVKTSVKIPAKQEWDSIKAPAKQPAAKVVTHEKTEKPSTAWTPVEKPAFSAPAAELKTKLGNPPSDNCAWDFVLSCAQQASNHGDLCLKLLAKSSDNCFSDSTCASNIGTDAPNCATCYESLGKQKFITAVHNEKSHDNVAPIFTSLVSYGVCDNNGKAAEAWTI